MSADVTMDAMVIDPPNPPTDHIDPSLIAMPSGMVIFGKNLGSSELESIATNIISFIDSTTDLVSIALTCKALSYYATVKLYRGEYFPVKNLSRLISRWNLLNMLRRRPDLANHVRTFKITEGQESLEQLAVLRNLVHLSIEYREKREVVSGYHDLRLVEFLRQHQQIETLDLTGAISQEPDMSPVSLPKLSKLELNFSELPSWLNLTNSQLTHLRLTGAKGRVEATMSPNQDDSFFTGAVVPDPTNNRFPDDSTLISMSKVISRIEYLDISCCVDITAAGLSIILQSVPQLKGLAMHFCQKIDIAAAISNQPSLPFLTHLRLNCKIRCGQTITTFSSYSGEIRSRAILQLVCPRSQNVRIQAPDGTLTSHSAFGPRLESLTISGQTTLWERRILLPGFVKDHNSSLKKITLLDNMISEEELANVCEKCTELVELAVINPSDLHDPTLSPFILSKAQRLQRVEHSSGSYLIRRSHDKADIELVRV